jgi:hypothetical protein
VRTRTRAPDVECVPPDLSVMDTNAGGGARAGTGLVSPEYSVGTLNKDTDAGSAPQDTKATAKTAKGATPATITPAVQVCCHMIINLLV